MNCLEFRRHVLPDPYALTAEARSHRDSCATCRRFYDEIHELDQSTYKALKIDLPEGLAARILLNQSLKNRLHRPSRRQWLALAASFLITAGVLLVQWFTQNPHLLDDGLVAHVETELALARQMVGPVEQSRIRKVLNEINADTSGPLPDIIFAKNCVIDGELIAHFVVEEAGQQYTVMLIPQRDLKDAVAIAREGWLGIVRPHQGGGLAVLANAGHSNPETVARIADRYSRSLIKQGA